MMYFDGSLMKKGTGVGLVFISPLKVRMGYMVWLHFPSSNNVVEYEALINGLRIAIELGIQCLDIWGDSQLVVNQVMKESSCQDGYVLPRSLTARGQVRRPQTQSHPKAPQRGGQRACEGGVRSGIDANGRLRQRPTQTLGVLRRVREGQRWPT